MSEEMKRCAMCGKEYEASYDGCPHCAAKAKASQASPKDTAVGCLILIVLIGIVVFGLSMCGGKSEPSADSPELAAKVQTAIATEGDDVLSAIHDVTAQTDGSVIVTLAVAKESLGTDVQVSDIGNGLASMILTKVPEVKQVSVFDGNNKLIDIYTPK